MIDTDGLEIRIGTPDDLDEVMRLSTLAAGENGFLMPDPEKVLHAVWAGLTQQGGIVGIIGKPGGQIEGGVVLTIGGMWYSSQNVVEERVIFIHPDYRSAKGGRARKLCEFSKRVADTFGLPLIIGVLSNNRTEAKVRMYERQLGKPAGAFFLHNAKTGVLAGTEQ